MEEIGALAHAAEESVACTRCGGEAIVRMYPGYLCAACALAAPASDALDRPVIVCDRCDREAAIRVGSRFLCAGCALEGFGLASQGVPLLADLYVDALLRVERLERRIGRQALEIEEARARLRRSDHGRRALLGHLVRIQEEERRSLANELHDDAMQVLIAVGMRLHTLRRTTDDPVESWRLRELDDAIRSATDRLRFLASGLRPEPLEREGLTAALRQHLREMQAQFGLSWHLEDHLTREPQPAVATILYRVAQEAVTNVRKHARASRALVALGEREGGFLLRVTDDGIGYGEGSEAVGPGHLGLTSMRERAELAGGTFRIESPAGSGTIVEAWIPAPTTEASMA